MVFLLIVTGSFLLTISNLVIHDSPSLSITASVWQHFFVRLSMLRSYHNIFVRCDAEIYSFFPLARERQMHPKM